MKKLLLALVVSLVVVPSALATRTIYVRDASQKVSQQEVQTDMFAFTAALADFGSVWGKRHVGGHRISDTVLQLLPLGASAPAKAWTITVTDQPDCFACYGYHDLKGKVPFAEVGTDGNWTVTFTHELDEMLADPYINYTHRLGQRKYLIEVADPPEDDSFAYAINWPAWNPVLVSDFVTPAWYRPNSPGPYDFRHLISQPLQLLCGGYVSFLVHGAWGQSFAPDC